MSVRVRCPKCGNQFCSKKPLAGTIVNCPQCGQKLAVGRASAPVTGDENPEWNLIRQMMRLVAEYNKHDVVSRLSAARQRIRAQGKKCEGRKRFNEARKPVGGKPDTRPEQYHKLLDAARAMREERKTYTEIATEFNAQGLPRLAGRGGWTSDAVRVLLGLRARKRQAPGSKPGG